VLAVTVVFCLVVVVSGFAVSQLLRRFVGLLCFWFGLSVGLLVGCASCHKLPRLMRVATCVFSCWRSAAWTSCLRATIPPLIKADMFRFMLKAKVSCIVCS
jgi:hypothetical protein